MLILLHGGKVCALLKSFGFKKISQNHPLFVFFCQKKPLKMGIWGGGGDLFFWVFWFAGSDLGRGFVFFRIFSPKGLRNWQIRQLKKKKAFQNRLKFFGAGAFDFFKKRFFF